MQGSFLRFYVHEGQRHHHGVVWEWLLMQANKLGVRGGSAFRAMAGFGRHHKLNEVKFFDLKGSQVIEVEFVVTDQEAQQLLDLVHRERIGLFYAYIPARFGAIEQGTAAPPSIIGGE
jgi:PII-like signaling protein